MKKLFLVAMAVFISSLIAAQNNSMQKQNIQNKSQRNSHAPDKKVYRIDKRTKGNDKTKNYTKQVRQKQIEIIKSEEAKR